jgi:hypothetical protein
MSIPDRPRSFHRVDGETLFTWPEDAAIDLFHTGPTVGSVRFSDSQRWLPRLQGLVLEAAADRSAMEPIAGGAFRIDDILEWEDGVLDLIDARAWKLVTSMLSSQVRVAQASAIVVPANRELPMRQSSTGHASVVMLVDGGGLELRHESIRMAPVQPPANFEPGGMIAHPSSMRPCVLSHAGPDPVMLLTWDYAVA